VFKTSSVSNLFGVKPGWNVRKLLQQPTEKACIKALWESAASSPEVFSGLKLPSNICTNHLSQRIAIHQIPASPKLGPPGTVEPLPATEDIHAGPLSSALRCPPLPEQMALGSAWATRSGGLLFEFVGFQTLGEKGTPI
jgi:hypothetical protein